jgi:hypothetical protein
MSDLVEIYRAASGPQAHVVRNFLQQAGIPAVVDGDLLQGLVGELPTGWSTAPRVLVSADHAAWAKTLIEAVETTDDDPLPEQVDEIEDVAFDD